ncbi:MAG: asparaginase [Acidobacteria bacterium]|nr:asparaginase [Acidobacteriota bacterium]
MIGLLFTGGTISMRIDPATGAAVPALGAAEILAQVPQLGDVAAFEIEDFSRLPGPHVTPEQMWRLARRTAAWLERPDIDGVVITHGTDTIEETAFLLDLVLTSAKPVVLVGAMRTVSDPSWDGPANLLAATRVASSPAARGQGVLVVMDDLILPARDVRKVHTEASGAFAAPEFGPLGVVDGGVVHFRRCRPPRPSWDTSNPSLTDAGLRVGRLETRVSLLQVYTGIQTAIVDAHLADQAPGQATLGIAIVAFGRGNVPPAVVAPLQAALDRGVLVTVSSRCLSGRVSPRYGYAGGGLELANAGALLVGELPGSKARLLQMVALGGTTTRDEAARIIERVTA